MAYAELMGVNAEARCEHTFIGSIVIS